jgi:outer membrane translocation and assembly module TamA
MRILFSLLLLAILVQPANVGAARSSSGLRQDLQSDEDAPEDIRCGQILVSGSDQLTRTEMCQLLGEASGHPFDSETRQLAHATLITEYRRRGFLEADLSWNETERNADPSAPAVILVVKEGPVYRLHRLEMIGNANTRDRVIRRRVALNEGTPFDEDLLRLSIRRINQLGIFEEFTRDDIEARVNKKGHYVDLRFRLKEKQQLTTSSASDLWPPSVFVRAGATFIAALCSSHGQASFLLGLKVQHHTRAKRYQDESEI